MNRQNEKGQTLVSFALILPILVMLFALVIDTGYTYLEEKQLKDGVLIGLKYGMKHHEEDVKDQVRELIVENVDNISILNIYMEENQIKIQAKKPKKNIFTSMFLNDSSELEVIYTAYLNEDEWKIVKERG